MRKVYIFVSSVLCFAGALCFSSDRERVVIIVVGRQGIEMTEQGFRERWLNQTFSNLDQESLSDSTQTFDSSGRGVGLVPFVNYSHSGGKSEKTCCARLCDALVSFFSCKHSDS